MRHSHRTRRALFATIAACAGSLALAGSGAALSPSATVAAPVYQLDYRFTAVGGKRPPNIVETRIAGKGRLGFDESPKEGQSARSSTTSGTVVVEFDILTPHPRTEQITLSVELAHLRPHVGNGGEAIVFVLEVVESTIPGCSKGEKGSVAVSQTKTDNSIALQLGACNLRFGQKAGTARNSRVQVNLTGKCLARRGAAAGGEPLCKSETTFTLVPALTKVENGLPKAVKINAAGGTVVWNNCCDGAVWKVTVTFKAPGKVTVGKVAKMPISILVSDVKPEQPLFLSMTVAAPGFREDFGIQYPKQPSGSKTLAIPMPASLKNAKEFQILVGFGLAHVTYTYRRAA